MVGKFSHTRNGKHLRYVEIVEISGGVARVKALQGKIAGLAYDVVVSDLRDRDGRVVEPVAVESQVEMVILSGAFADFCEGSGDIMGYETDDYNRELREVWNAGTVRRQGRGYRLTLEATPDVIGWIEGMAQVVLSGGGEWSAAEIRGASGFLNR